MNYNIERYAYYKCYDELYKTYTTDRLILQRTHPNDFSYLAKIIINKKVNFHYQRPIMYLEDLQKAKEYVQNHARCTICFTIKLKPNPENSYKDIPIGQIGFYYANYTCQEIGIFYYLGEEYQKKGYATEAACPLVKHLFENLPLTTKLKIDFCSENFASKKLANKICQDIMKSHPNFEFGELTPFTDKYTLLNKPPIDGKVQYFFDGIDRKYYVTYPQDYFNHAKYFEVLSNGYYIKKK